jgi:HEAT repeat protein
MGELALLYLAAQWKDEEAQEALVRIGKPAIPAIIREGHDGGALARIGPADDKDIPLLIEEVRLHSVVWEGAQASPTALLADDVLVRTGEPAVLPLLRLLADPRPEKKENESYIRQHVLGLLVRIGPPALPHVRTALKHRDPGYRANALQAIVWMSYQQQPPINPLPELRGALRDEDVSVRAVAAETLASLALNKDRSPAFLDAIGDLARTLSDPDERIRAWSAMALARFGTRAHGALPELRKALGDSSAEVRFWAAFALTDRVADEKERAVPVLLDLFRSPAPPTWPAQGRPFISGRLLTESPAGRKALLPVLTERLRRPLEPDALRDTLTLLVECGDNGATAAPQLLPRLERGTADGRELACEALLVLGPAAPDVTAPALRKLFAQGKPEARWLAFLALAAAAPEEARKAVPEAAGIVAVLSSAETRRALTGYKNKDDLWWGRLEPSLSRLLEKPLEDLKATARETGALLAGSRNDRYDYFRSPYFKAISRCQGPAAAEAGEVLVGMLAADYPDAVKAARDALLGMGRSAIPALCAGLKSKQPEPVLVTLGLLGPDAGDAVPALVPLLTGEESVRASAAETLGRIGPGAKAALPNLIAAFKDSNAWRAAIRAVSRIGKDAVPLLIEALKDPAVPIRAGSAEALGRIGTDAKRAVPHLLVLRDRESEDAAVREAAAEALKLLDPD